MLFPLAGKKKTILEHLNGLAKLYVTFCDLSTYTPGPL